MISGHGTIGDAVEATRMGAFDFLEKPLARDRVLLVVKNAIEWADLQRENQRFRELVGDAPRMIGSAPSFQQAVRQATQVARSDVTRPAVGRVGHRQGAAGGAHSPRSPFASGPFVKVNCAAIPTELIESELFGHEKGAFTGAAALRRGKFELADGGTIFLDEVGDLHEASQAKLPAPKPTSAEAITAPSYDRGKVVQPRYPVQAYRNREQGEVLLSVVVGSDGKPKKVTVDRTSGSSLLDRAAVAAVKGWKFTPGTKNGVPQEAARQVAVGFKLDD